MRYKYDRYVMFFSKPCKGIDCRAPKHLNAHFTNRFVQKNESLEAVIHGLEVGVIPNKTHQVAFPVLIKHRMLQRQRVLVNPKETFTHGTFPRCGNNRSVSWAYEASNGRLVSGRVSMSSPVYF